MVTTEQMWKARSHVVREFRHGRGGYEYPHHKNGEHWYLPEEWTDDGTYLGHNPEAREALGLRPIQKTDSQADSVTTDSSDSAETDSLILSRLEVGTPIREIAGDLGVSIGRVQRVKAKSKMVPKPD